MFWSNLLLIPPFQFFPYSTTTFSSISHQLRTLPCLEVVLYGPLDLLCWNFSIEDLLLWMLWIYRIVSLSSCLQQHREFCSLHMFGTYGSHILLSYFHSDLQVLWKGCDIYIPFRAVHSDVSYLLYLDQSWFFIFLTIYYKKKKFWIRVERIPKNLQFYSLCLYLVWV